METGTRRVDTNVVIIGTGFAGLAMAVRLRQAGRDDFVMLEKADEVGGTWRENRYPGCACDIPSHLYSFSFAPNPHWSRWYAEQPEIWRYLKDVTARHGLREHIRFGSEVIGCEFDDATRTWSVSLAGGDVITCEVVIAGMGPLHQPRRPSVPGLDRFRGVSFHSATWNHDHDLTGKRVAVIGTGASAIQFIPRIVDKVARLHVIQRTPPWILPKADRPIRDGEKRLFALIPGARRLWRAGLYWAAESRSFGFSQAPRILALASRIASAHLARQVPDPALRAALTPDYTMGCKRVLISDDYYPALGRDHVSLETSALTEVTETGIVTADGTEHEVDVIIYGTGFHVTDALADARLVGRNGLRIQDAWRDGIQAYHGMAVAGFPNLFLLLGPNTGLGHNSVVLMIEAQVKYVMRVLARLRRHGLRTIEVKESAQRAFNEDLQRRLRRTVWSAGGCRSWYLDGSGVNRVLWPGSTLRYFRATRRVNPADFLLEA